ncbi:pyrroloquinoline quinone (Coenzyme PQQ) biosynthesis protein C [Cenarchaeum symbiosum A]|uniref:Pyrroloquinoline quinone (Coenzyme PQQ) biosynthesis protein C n=1 Tax=Cenarchaeum symbiosum (strain A) TaxID=414004 RepID=A0RY84_CENSY|nr:pyrroloquinoline quinone (Coenzyme PQQ) biosynthesis protein C [Cenarchaeum symbiosum A]
MAAAKDFFTAPSGCKHELVAEIDRMVEERSLLKHPFYVMWSDGDLTLDSLAGYSKEYFQLVKAVPGFMSPIVDAAPPGVAGELAENMQEEEDHILPWTRFARSLGVDGEELSTYAGLDETRRAVGGLSALMGSYEGGACAMYAFEKEIPEISRIKMEGLAEFYGITGAEATEYFRLHTEADIRHAASWRGILEGASGQHEGLLEAAKRSISAQNLLLDGCHRAYCTVSA